jgi:small subunit ribosomal protein S9
LIDDESKETSKQDETSVEGSEESPAGPVAEDSPEATPPAGPVAAGDPPPPPVAKASSGAVPPATPPAGEAEESQGEAPSTESETSTESEGEAEQPEEKAQKPKPKAEEKAEKKDVIPGADLEPIAVEPEERPLSAEEQARLEAEEEERARREAELVGEAEEEPRSASRAPAKLEGDARYLATGKRKTSIARVTLLPGSGKIEVNKRSLEEFFPRPLHQTMAKQPLTTTGYESNVDVRVRVHGGGISGQAGAVRHGIARALTEIDPELRGELKRRGFLTRDARAKERRKAGLKKARKRPQFSKR